MLCLVCCGREKYGPFIALTPNIDWWVKRSLYPGTRGEKVSKLRSCQYVIFCLSNAQKSSPSTEIQLYNIVHICFVCTLHICLLYTVWNKVMFVKSRGPYQLTAHYIPLLASERHNVKSAVDHFGSFFSETLQNDLQRLGESLTSWSCSSPL